MNFCLSANRIIELFPYLIWQRVLRAGAFARKHGHSTGICYFGNIFKTLVEKRTSRSQIPEWKDHLKELVAGRISNFEGHFKSPECKVLNLLGVQDTRGP